MGQRLILFGMRAVNGAAETTRSARFRPTRILATNLSLKIAIGNRLLGHSKLEHTIVYLHLSQKHLTSVANPLDTISVVSPDNLKRSRKKQKRYDSIGSAPAGRVGGEGRVGAGALFD
jgi:hypothetical protein